MEPGANPIKLALWTPEILLVWKHVLYVAFDWKTCFETQSVCRMRRMGAIIKRSVGPHPPDPTDWINLDCVIVQILQITSTLSSRCLESCRLIQIRLTKCHLHSTDHHPLTEYSVWPGSPLPLTDP